MTTRNDKIELVKHLASLEAFKEQLITTSLSFVEVMRLIDQFYIIKPILRHCFKEIIEDVTNVEWQCLFQNLPLITDDDGRMTLALPNAIEQQLSVPVNLLSLYKQDNQPMVVIFRCIEKQDDGKYLVERIVQSPLNTTFASIALPLIIEIFPFSLMTILYYQKKWCNHARHQLLQQTNLAALQSESHQLTCYQLENELLEIGLTAFIKDDTTCERWFKLATHVMQLHGVLSGYLYQLHQQYRCEPLAYYPFMGGSRSLSQQWGEIT